MEVVHSPRQEPTTGGNIEIVRPGGSVVLDGYTVEVRPRSSHPGDSDGADLSQPAVRLSNYDRE